MLGPAGVPEITDPVKAEQEVELAVLSAVAHGNGPNGLAVLKAALRALARLDLEHAAVYLQSIYDALHEPMRRALEALVMEQPSEGKANWPSFAQQIFEYGYRLGYFKSYCEGYRTDELKGKRDVLVRLLARAGIALTEEERARIEGCEDPGTLNRWAENVLGAKTAADVLT